LTLWLSGHKLRLAHLILVVEPFLRSSAPARPSKGRLARACRPGTYL